MPTNVFAPRSLAHAMSFDGGKASTAGTNPGRILAVTTEETSSGSLCVRYNPPRPASRNFRATDGVRSVDRHPMAVARDDLRREEAGRTCSNDGDVAGCGGRFLAHHIPAFDMVSSSRIE